MSKIVKSNERFISGIADYPTEDATEADSSFAFARSIDHRSDPASITILPKTIKESGSIITDLPKWGTTYSSTMDTYLYGDAGNIYKRTSAGSTTFLRTVAASHGNGMNYFGEDDFIYYTGDKVIGRYGPLSGTPQFVDDFFGSQGGVPLNTNSLDLEASSSQYADRADSASLSITGNLAIDVQIKPESLPTVGNTMTLVSKWSESGNQRSYKFDIAAVSGYFGDGTDGVLTISANTTEAPIDSSCSGTVGTYTLSATNASFASGQVVLIHQSRGTGAGTWQRNTISGYTAGTITLMEQLNATYTDSGASQAQVRVLKQYTDVTVNTGITYTAKAWDGDVGGILSFIASGTITINGTINGAGLAGVATNSGTGSGSLGGQGIGFRGGNGRSNFAPTIGGSGEGTAGPSVTTAGSNTLANGNGGGGGYSPGSNQRPPGAGGGNGTAGTNATVTYFGGSPSTGGTGAVPGVGGIIAGTDDLTTMVFGGGGGGAGHEAGTSSSGAGGGGGGIVFLIGTTVIIHATTGLIDIRGGVGGSPTPLEGNGGGGGAGGSALIKAQVATLNTDRILATGGAGGNGTRGSGTAGGNGRIVLNYYTSYTGTTTTPTLNAIQDNSLVTNTSYQVRLAISSNGTNSETLAQVFVPQIGSWQEVGVSWTASTSTAIFYFNAVAIGTRTGTLTSIFDSTSRFAIGAYFNSGGTATGFYDGLIDEVRVFNKTRSDSDFFNGLQSQILTTTAGLQGYWKLNGDYADATANSNTLSGVNTPVFTTDVPYPSPTTRLDIDQSATTAGNTYTVPVAISESATNRKTFTPEKDPQKSIAVLVASIGTGNWTITVHDQYNNVITTLTVANALMSTGYYEFIFSTTWRPLINANYHFHLTSTVADGTVTTGTSSDLETVSYRTYFQFLVTDTAWHPVDKMLQFMVFGNERYVGTYEATLYEPNAITLAANERVRCFGKWGEYLAIGIMRGESITDFDQGRVYFWDGIAPTYNFFIDVPEGGINALYGVKDTLYIWAGYQGDILEYKGGSTAQKIRRIPLVNNSTAVEIYPGAVGMWKALLRFGVAGSVNNTVIQQGVYTYGSLNRSYAESLSYDYPISTGTLASTSLKIGLCMAVGGKLLIGWQDNVSYGLDYVDANNEPYPTATIEFLIRDNETAWKYKEANVVVASFNPLASGESITVKYKLDADVNWIPNPDGATTTVGAVESRQILSAGQFRRYQIAADLATTTTTAPTIQAVTVEMDDQAGSQRV